jgi:hypothetical protein
MSRQKYVSGALLSFTVCFVGGHLTYPIALSGADIRRSYREVGRDDRWARPGLTPSISGIWRSRGKVTSQRRTSCVVRRDTSMP